MFVGLNLIEPHDEADESADWKIAATLQCEQMMERILD
jgi:hypothetical protein